MSSSSAACGRIAKAVIRRRTYHGRVLSSVADTEHLSMFNSTHHRIPQHHQQHPLFCAQRRGFGNSSNEKSGQEHHQDFQEQLMELQAEREALFGASVNDDGKDNAWGTTTTTDVTISDNSKPSKGGQGQQNDDEEDFLREQLLEFQAEREALYGFTDEEKDAWSNLSSPSSFSSSSLSFSSTTTTTTTVGEMVEHHRQQQQKEEQRRKQRHQRMIQAIEQARLAEDQQRNNENSSTTTTTASSAPPTVNTSSSSVLTHLSEDGTSIHMVDVGSKTSTQRMAKAQTKVIFPPEVVDAFLSYGNNSTDESNKELIGPKGPIFATAKVAGIMAAK